jgi:NADH-quinone oxidoreductase subunit L
MPITHSTFLIACLTIAGIPPFSGFFSNDEILVAAFEHNKMILPVQWLVTGHTAFYLFRLYFNIFWNRSPAYQHKPHESSFTMTLPLVVLAAASVIAGFIPFNKLVTSDGKAFETDFHWMIAVPSVLMAVVGIGAAAFLYYKQNPKSENISLNLKGFYTAALQKFYIDELYLFITHRVIFKLVSAPVAWFDRHIVDGTMNFIGNATVSLSGAIKKMQSGHMQLYIWFFTSGALVLTLVILYLI